MDDGKYELDAMAARGDGEKVCPWLGAGRDDQTRYAFATPAHWCHRAKPAAPVALFHQEAACLGEGFRGCPVVTGAAVTLPDALRRSERLPRPGRTWRTVWALLLLAVLLILVTAGGIWLAGGLPVGSPTAQALVIRASQTPTATLSPTPPPPPSPTTQPAPGALSTAPSTPTLLPATPTVTPPPSATPTPLQPTPGPQWGERFGPDEMLVLHLVQPDESLFTLETLYQTTRAVIYAANAGLAEGRSIQPGEVLVVLPGRSDAAETPRFAVVQMERATLLSDVALVYGVTVEALRLYNSLGPGDWAPYERWLVIPVEP